MRRMKQSLTFVSANFNCQRMVGEYRSQLYEPAHAAYVSVMRDHFAPARERARWNQNVTEKWPRVNFVTSTVRVDSAVLTGSPVPFRTSVDLAGLEPQDVRVEAVVGRVAASGELEETQVLTLAPLEQHGTVFTFGRDFSPFTTGRLGYSLRVTPNHYDDPLNRPCHALMKWAGE
jgi:starch phosphorylase